MLSKNDYFLKAIENDWVYEISWTLIMFSIYADDSKWVRKTSNGFEVYTGEDYEKVNWVKPDAPIINWGDTVTIHKDKLKMLEKDITTSIGLIMLNLVLVEFVFDGLVKYLGDKASVKYIENTVLAKHLKSTKDAGENDITIKHLDKLGFAASYIQQWVPVSVYSASAKAITPPPGIKTYKKKVMKEMEDKYGEDVWKSYARVAELETILKDYDKEYVKDDPSFNIVMDGKILNNARRKQYLMFGAEPGFSSSPDADFVPETLLEGYPKDAKKLAAIFNTVRLGSYSRGVSTQESGVDAKVLTRATSSFKIVKTDCKSKLGLEITVNKVDGDLVGRYMLSGSTPVLIEDIKTLVGKTIKIRSPMYCKMDGDNLCSICMGELAGGHERGLSLAAADQGGAMLNARMKAMHSSTLSTKRIDIINMIS